jgi:gentisate 1,2-dioxygenase
MTALAAPALVAPGQAQEAAGTASRWDPVGLRRSDIDEAVDRLLTAPREGDDLRRVLLVHPAAAGRGTGLAPGIEVSIETLAPGEEARPPRRNSTALALQIHGTSEVVVDAQVRQVGERDLYSVPSFAVQSHVATGTEPSVRLVFSNAALLEFLGAHLVQPVEDGDEPLPETGSADLSVRNDGRVGALGSEAWRLEYERMVDPPWVPRRSWHWRWSDIQGELDRVETLDQRYRGRRVCLPYDPTTGRTNGSTSTLVASMCVRPAHIVDRPHRHTAAAVNYFMQGSGWSRIGDRHLEWDGGDLVFVAPSWEVHHHTSGDEDVYQLAVQDNPLHLAMGSLVWQEDLGEPFRVLGGQPGFTTNRHQVESAPS